ncbi:MAG: hypothetical protein IPJ61_13745 [Tessaracoccus sp.]|uniref:hypothetical protein n=1 Tax=Tessaracoccus sp. TaxID=1971211 RepID=UPI001ECD92ED|nr:hypothetical protein [Tessaracoccus sp.]MBK7822090.1 hypothetical protein [Tessaracoccus sp.]
MSSGSTPRAATVRSWQSHPAGTASADRRKVTEMAKKKSKKKDKKTKKSKKK